MLSGTTGGAALPGERVLFRGVGGDWGAPNRQRFSGLPHLCDQRGMFPDTLNRSGRSRVVSKSPPCALQRGRDLYQERGVKRFLCKPQTQNQAEPEDERISRIYSLVTNRLKTRWAPRQPLKPGFCPVPKNSHKCTIHPVPGTENGHKFIHTAFLVQIVPSL